MVVVEREIDGCAVFDKLPQAVTCFARDGTVVYANALASLMFERRSDELVGTNLRLLDDLPGGHALREAFERIADRDGSAYFTFFHAPWSRWFENNVVRAEDRLWVFGRDITAQKLATVRLQILANAFRSIQSGDLNSGGALDAIARDISDVVHDGCVIRLLSPDGQVLGQPCGAWDNDPLTLELLRGAPPDPVTAGHVAEVVRTRVPMVTRGDPLLVLPAGARELHLATEMIVPLVAHDEVLGTLGVYRRTKENVEPYTQTDLLVLEDLAEHAALVIWEWRAIRRANESSNALLVVSDALPVLISRVGPDGRYRFVNRTYETWFQERRSDIVGKSPEELLGTAAFDVIRNHVERALAGEQVSFESRVAYAGAGTRDVRAQYVPLTSDGRPDGFVALINDVTDDRLASQESMRASEERLHLALEAGGMATWDLNLRDGTAVWSSNHFKVLGYDEVPSGRATMQMWRERVHPDDLVAVDHAFDVARRTGGLYTPDHRILRMDNGEIRWLSVAGRFLYDDDGEPVRMVGVFFDITNRKRAEEASKESEERFRTLADSAPVLIWVNSPSGCEYVNRTYCEFLGVSMSDVRNFDWAEYVHPEDRGPYVTSYLRAAGGRTPFQAEFRLRRYDGEYRWMRSVANPRFSPEREYCGYVGASLDITDSKRAQFDSDRFITELRAAVAVRDEFLSVASHELRTPLTALGLQLERMVTLLSTEDAHARTRAMPNLRFAIRQADRLDGLIEGLLDVSRLRAGQLVLQIESFDLRDLVTEVVERLAALASTGRCELHVSVASQPVVGTWDRARVDVVLMNLLTNAIKYGGGTPISVKLESAPEHVTLEVHDGGIGIAPKDHERIFDQFERAVSSNNYGGLGLGLYISQRIVAAHGGTITVESTLGNGARFVIRLPRFARSSMPRSTSPESSPGGGR